MERWHRTQVDAAARQKYTSSSSSSSNSNQTQTTTHLCDSSGVLARKLYIVLLQYTSKSVFDSA